MSAPRCRNGPEPVSASRGHCPTCGKAFKKHEFDIDSLGRVSEPQHKCDPAAIARFRQDVRGLRAPLRVTRKTASCKRCRHWYTVKSNVQKYCTKCAAELMRERCRKYYHGAA